MPVPHPTSRMAGDFATRTRGKSFHSALRYIMPAVWS